MTSLTRTSPAAPDPLPMAPLGACLMLGRGRPLHPSVKKDLPYGLTAIYLTHAELILLDAGMDLRDFEGRTLWD